MTTYLCSIERPDETQRGIRYKYIYGTREGCRLYASQGVYVGVRSVRLVVEHGADKVARFAAHINGDYVYKGVMYGAGVTADTAGVIGGDALKTWLSPLAIPNIPVSPLVTSDASTADDPKKDNSLIKYGVIVVGVIIMIMVIISKIARK